MAGIQSLQATLALLDEIAADDGAGTRRAFPRAGETLDLIMAERLVPVDAEAAALEAFEVGALSLLAGNGKAPAQLLTEQQIPPTDWFEEVLTVTATAWLRLASGDPDAAQAARNAHLALAARQKDCEKPYLDAADSPRQAACRLAAVYFMSTSVRQAADGDMARAEETANRAMRFADQAAVTLWAAANWLRQAVRSAPLGPSGSTPSPTV